MRPGHARRIVCPAFGQIHFAVNEGMTVWRDMAGEDANLAIRDLARRTGILRRKAADRATRACVRSGRIRRLTSSKDDAHNCDAQNCDAHNYDARNSNVVSIEAPAIPRPHDETNHGDPLSQNSIIMQLRC